MITKPACSIPGIVSTLNKMFHPPRAKGPTHADITNFLETFLPPSLNLETQAREVPYLYHTVRHPAYSPTTQLTSRIVFSITPTPGVYTSLNVSSPRYRSPICFLHRPFNLDRRAVRRGTLVLASHKSFDQHLTVGFNTALADRLDLDLSSAVCIQGYKGDDERKIGLVARLPKPTLLGDLVEKLKLEFSGAGELFETRATEETPDMEGQSNERSISVVAIMNAFHAEEVERVLDAAHTAGWTDDVEDGSQILYLTGAAREYGIEAVARVSMAAFCVGHVACEEWGIRYLAQRTRERWPDLEVIEVFEEEEQRPAGKRKKGTAAEEASVSEKRCKIP